jgi:cytoskeletal protein RodZ
MKPRKFFPVLLVFLFALIGVGLWWFLRPSATALVKTATASPPAKIDSVKIIAPPVQVESPKIPAVPTHAEAAINATPLSANPQADLKTAIPDLARLAAAGQSAELHLYYYPPGRVNHAQVDVLMKQEAETQHLLDISSPDSRFVQGIQKLRAAGEQSWINLEAQTPTYNAAGDEATYCTRFLMALVTSPPSPNL